MAQVVFLLLTLMLHLAQTTCQGDNCTTGEFYLEFQSAKLWLIIQINENLLFLFAGLIISGGAGARTRIETFPADDPSCNIPPFPNPGNLSSSHPFILLSREIRPLPLCRRQWAATCGVRRVGDSDFLHLLAQWAR